MIKSRLLPPVVVWLPELVAAQVVIYSLVTVHLYIQSLKYNF